MIESVSASARSLRYGFIRIHFRSQKEYIHFAYIYIFIHVYI